jgi:transmembrane sensor
LLNCYSNGIYYNDESRTFWLLIAKKIAKEANEQELVELSQYIQDHPEWQFAIQNLENIWEIPLPNNQIEAEDAFMLHLNKIAGNNTNDFLEEQNTAKNPTRIIPKWVLLCSSIISDCCRIHVFPF